MTIAAIPGSAPGHLIERAAWRLNGTSGLLMPEPVALEPRIGDGGTSAAMAERAAASFIQPKATSAPPPILDIATLEQAGLMVGRKTRTRISEEFRIAAGHVLRAMPAAASRAGASNVLMITSARPGEGKSLSTMNLASSIAQYGLREVLMVDIDAKRRSITHELGLQDCAGVLDLAGEPARRPEDMIVRTAIGNLAILPIGTHITNAPTDACDPNAGKPIDTVITRLARRFPNHIIVLDAPPCLSTSDPSTIAPVVGQIVMVVEAEQTQRSEVEASLDLVKACANTTLLLNKVRLTTSCTFGAYHYSDSYS
jgi:receptor protein-tyrosine kinase